MHLIKVKEGIFINLDVMKTFYIEAYATKDKVEKGNIVTAGAVQKYRVKGFLPNGKAAILKVGLDSLSLAEEWLIKLSKGIVKLDDISELNVIQKSNIIIP